MLDPTTVNGTTGLSADFDGGFFSLQAPITTTGFIPNPGTVGWKNGSVIILGIDDIASQSNVRLLSPQEEWQSYYKGELNGPQTPTSIQFLGLSQYYENWGSLLQLSSGNKFIDLYDDSARLGPAYPADQMRHEPFIMLGGIVNTGWSATIASADMTSAVDGIFEVDMGIDFDAADLGIGEFFDIDVVNVVESLLYGTRSLYDMITAGGTDITGFSSELFLVTYGDPTAGGVGNNGAFRIIGAGTKYGQVASSGTSLTVQSVSRDYAGNDIASGAVAITAEIRSPYTSSQDNLTTQLNSAVVVLTNLEATLLNSFAAETPPINAPMVLRLTAVYENNRGLSHAADTVSGVFIDGVSSVETLREPIDAIDAAFAASGVYPEDQIGFDPQDLQKWSRFPDKGDQGENGREGEVFFDGPSKTLVVRPYQVADVRTISLFGREGGTDMIPRYYDDGVTLVDGAETFQDPVVDNSLSTTKYAFPYPMELLPSFGRQDIPYNYGTDTILPGINHLFRDTGTDAGDVYRIIGGPSVTGGGGGVSSMLAWSSSGGTYGNYGTITGALADGYQSRIITLRSEISKQTGNLMHGIELPPFVGIARLYGVYEIADYIANESGPVPGGFDADRVTPRVGGPTNLLREGANRQTLFIRKGGADTDTGVPDSHTYVVPENALDLHRISSFDPTSENLTDYNYVLEFVYFGFTPGFINRNSYILIRRTDGQDATVSNDTLVGTALTNDTAMIVPWALPVGTDMYITYDRKVYQGDPYHTRGVSTVNSSEAAVQYGSIDRSDAFALATVARQYDDQGDHEITMPLPRPLEVLSVVDFWTTLGTGRMTTPLYSGTEPGWMDGPLIPVSATSPERSPSARALTKVVGKSASSITMQVNDYTALVDSDGISNASLTFFWGNRIYVTKLPPFVGSYLTVTSNEEMAEALYVTLRNDEFVMNHFYVEQRGTIITLITFEKGESANNIRVTLTVNSEADPAPTLAAIIAALSIRSGNSAEFTGNNLQNLLTYSLPGSSQVQFSGGEDYLTLPVSEMPRTYAGAVSRLPLGAAVNESDFLGETLNGALLGIQDARNSTSLTSEQGTYLVQSEGAVGTYSAWNGTTGTTFYRTARGTALASVNGLTAEPLSWGLGKPDCHTKGAVLIGRAFLVRNQQETAFTSPSVRTYGGELQLVIATSTCPAHSGSLSGEIGAIGYGEGFAAADRYLITGRPCTLLNSQKDITGISAGSYIEETGAEEVLCICP